MASAGALTAGKGENGSAAAPTSSSLASQYSELHEFVLSTVEEIREDLTLVDFLAFLVVYFAIDEPLTRAEFFDKWQGAHYINYPFEIDAIALGAGNELRSALLEVSTNKLKIGLAKASREYLVEFLSLRDSLRALLEKHFLWETSVRLATRRRLMVDVEALARLEAKVDAERKLPEIKWAVNQRMRSFLLGSSSSPSTAMDTIKFRPESEPSTDTPYYKNYVDKLVPHWSPPAKATAENGIKKAKVSIEDDAKWPSIAMMSFFDASNSLVSLSSSALDQGKCIAAGFEEGVARVYTSSKSSSTTPDDTFGQKSFLLVGHSQPVYGVSVFNSRVVTCAGDGQARLWMPQGEEYRNVMVYGAQNDVPLYTVGFAPFGHLFCVGGRGGHLKMFGSDSPDILRTFTSSNAHLDDVNAVMFHPNAHLVLSAGADRTVKAWDLLSNNRCMRTLITGLTQPIETLACDPSGRFVAAGGSEGRICLLDLVSGKRIKMLDYDPVAGPKTKKPVLSMSWSQDGNYLAASSGNSVKVWSTTWAATEGELEDEPIFRTFRTKCDPVMNVNFISKGVILAGGIMGLDV